jgi:hypothetical protein
MVADALSELGVGSTLFPGDSNKLTAHYLAFAQLASMTKRETIESGSLGRRG